MSRIQTPPCHFLASSISSNDRPFSKIYASTTEAVTTTQLHRGGLLLFTVWNTYPSLVGRWSQTTLLEALLAHLLALPSGVVVRLSIYIRGRYTDVVVACAIPLHHDLIPCTKSLKKIEFLRIPNSSRAALFSGDNFGVLRISASWRGGGVFEVSGARATCSFGSLDVSGVETLAVGNYLETHEHFTQALRSLVNLHSLTLWECDNEMTFYALRQEGTSPRLRYVAIDLLEILLYRDTFTHFASDILHLQSTPTILHHHCHAP